MKRLFTLLIFLFSLQLMAQNINVQFPVLYANDDADEVVEDNIFVNPGDVQLDNPELEMIYDDNVIRLCHQIVGIRFANVTVPQGVTITNAYIQFACKQTGSDVVNLIINAQNSNNPATFTASSANISARPLTTATVNWVPLGWYATDEAGVDQRTPDLSSLIQEIVSRAGWVSGNAMAIILSGTGSSRTAYAYDEDPAKVAVLHIQYSGVGIEESEVAINPVISPNPASDNFTLNINASIQEQVTFSVHTQMGSEVNDYGVFDHHDGSYTFDISSLPSGWYYLSIMTESNMITQKFIVI